MSIPTQKVIDPPIQRATEALKHALTGIAPTGPPAVHPSYHRVSLPRKALPLPMLPRLALLLLGCQPIVPGDKTQWAIEFWFDDVRCELASEKFGLRLYIWLAEVEAEALAKRLTKKLAKAQKKVERDVLGSLVDDQLKRNEVTLLNHYSILRGAYDYFRAQAQEAFDHSNKDVAFPPEDATPDQTFRFFTQVLAKSTQREGFYNSVAMLTAYFSLLEHILSLSLPFTRPAHDSVDLRKFLRLSWAEKFKYTFDVKADRGAKRAHDQLYPIAEDYRNVYAHGGHNKDGSSIIVQVPGLGAIPVAMSGLSDKPQFSFVPISEENFTTIVGVFDELDEWLTGTGLVDAMTWISSGNDVRFDPEFRAELNLARQSEDGFLRLLESVDRGWERQANME